MLAVPANISFQQAIELTQALVSRMEQGTLSDAEIAQTIAALVQTVDGARGFFVGYLTDDRSLADHPTEAVISALRTSPEVAADLLVKNLAMSTAVAITHRRNDNLDMAQGSDRVRSRTTALIQKLQLPEIEQKAKQLRAATETGGGEYEDFLNRWKYDTEQRLAIREAIEQVSG
ncbi:hypothetical protein NDI45_11985 [Leptolyngbya sp. GB1-A1]|uniref:hypothetical protein n=1 Tax=Leptolyngbya sp. GB1-A1 TaxID=2933908 RepID=UPI0032969E03